MGADSPRRRTGRQIALVALLLGALAGCSSAAGAPVASGAGASASAAGSGPGSGSGAGSGGDAGTPSAQATASGSPLPQPTATRPVKPPTEPTSKASATGPGGQPCKDLPAGYSAYARLTRAWTSGGRHLLALTFEECTFTPLDRQGVHYTPVGGRRTLTVRPDAVVQVLRNGTQLAPVPFAHFSVSAMGRPYYYVRLDASGAVAGIQQIYHP